MQVFVLERVIPPLVITFKLAVDSVSSNHIFALFLFLFNSHYLKKSVHGPGPKPFYKNKKVFMDLVHDRGSMESVQSGGPWTPGPSFVLWIQSNHRIEFSNLSFPIAHLPSGRLTCASSGKFLWRIRHPAGSWMVAAKIFPQFTQVSWASARRLIAHLIAYIKSINAMGECCYGFDLSMLMLILQHLVWSWSLWCFYMLFNCFFKECFNAKGRTKNRDIVFLKLFSLGFQRSCIETEVLCCTQSNMW